MKKIVIIFAFLFIILSPGFSQKKLSEIPSSDKVESESVVNDVLIPEELIITDKVPEIFNGIWEGQDRYIMFQSKKELDEIVKPDVQLKEDNYIWIYLKLFYGWYIDRAAEGTTRKTARYPYDRNDGTFRDIQNIKIQFKPLLDTEKCCAYEIIVNYPKIKEPVVIPVCIIDGKLYLDFAIKTNELPVNYETESENKKSNPLTGSWSSVGKVSGIKVSKPITKENLVSTYITDDSIYYIRYWKTDMPYSKDWAFFSDGKYKYEVPKHIRSAGNVYTCVTGRSVTIRNVERRNLPLENYVMGEEQNVIAFNEPYLTKIKDNCGLSEMMEIVKVSNSRKAPLDPPVFPPKEPDWVIEDTYSIEIQYKILRAVLKRQKEFNEKYPVRLHY